MKINKLVFAKCFRKNIKCTKITQFYKNVTTNKYFNAITNKYTCLPNTRIKLYHDNNTVLGLNVENNEINKNDQLKDLIDKLIKNGPSKDIVSQLTTLIYNTDTNTVDKIMQSVTLDNQLIKCILGASKRALCDDQFDKAVELYLMVLKNNSHMLDYNKDDWLCALDAFIGAGCIEYINYIYLCIKNLAQLGENADYLMSHVQLCGLEIDSYRGQIYDFTLRAIKDFYDLKKCPLNVIESAVLNKNSEFLISVKNNNLMPSFTQIMDGTELDDYNKNGDFQEYIELCYSLVEND